MNYLQKLLTREFKQGEEIRVDAKELQRLANHALRLEAERDMLRAKIAGYEIIERPEKIKLYA
jgi:hypothetical protein